MGDKCNRNNFFREGDRASTRTHHHMNAHHSKSSWSLGWGSDDSEPTPAAPAKRTPAAVVNEPAPAAPAPAAAPAVAQPPMKEVTNKPTASRVSANKYANGSNQNCGNVITDRPTTRIHAPPGGRSNIFFG